MRGFLASLLLSFSATWLLCYLVLMAAWRHAQNPQSVPWLHPPYTSEKKYENKKLRAFLPCVALVFHLSWFSICLGFPSVLVFHLSWFSICLGFPCCTLICKNGEKGSSSARPYTIHNCSRIKRILYFPFFRRCLFLK